MLTYTSPKRRVEWAISGRDELSRAASILRAWVTAGNIAVPVLASSVVLTLMASINYRDRVPLLPLIIWSGALLLCWVCVYLHGTGRIRSSPCTLAYLAMAHQIMAVPVHSLAPLEQLQLHIHAQLSSWRAIVIFWGLGGIGGGVLPIEVRQRQAITAAFVVVRTLVCTVFYVRVPEGGMLLIYSLGPFLSGMMVALATTASGISPSAMIDKIDHEADLRSNLEVGRREWLMQEHLRRRNLEGARSNCARRAIGVPLPVAALAPQTEAAGMVRPAPPANAPPAQVMQFAEDFLARGEELLRSTEEDLAWSDDGSQDHEGAPSDDGSQDHEGAPSDDGAPPVELGPHQSHRDD